MHLTILGRYALKVNRSSLAVKQKGESQSRSYKKRKSISPYSVRVGENTDQKKHRISFGHFSCSGGFCFANNTKLHYWNNIKFIYQFHPSVEFHIETNHLIRSANQMTGFYIEYNTGLKGVNGLY